MIELHQLLIPLRIVLAEALQEQKGLRLDSVHIEKVINRPFSDVAFLRATTSGGARKLVLKKTVHHPANMSITKSQNQAVVEYEILSKLYPQFQSVPHCHVPRPVLVMPEHEAYVMDFVEGRLLEDLFISARYIAPRKAFDELREYYYLSGVWLKKLQGFTGGHRESKEVFAYSLERCEQKLNLIEKANDSRCSPDLATQVRRLLAEQLDLVKDEDIIVTGRHGDFGSWNIMAGPEGITVFDFLGYKADLLPIDLLKMLTNFENEKTYVFYPRSRIDELKQCFLSGYGEVPIISIPILVICETMHRVCSLCACVDNPARSRRRRFEQGIAIKKHLEWIMKVNRKLLWPTESMIAS